MAGDVVFRSRYDAAYLTRLRSQRGIYHGGALDIRYSDSHRFPSEAKTTAALQPLPKRRIARPGSGTVDIQWDTDYRIFLLGKLAKKTSTLSLS